jgi:hypothetical protein
MYRRSLEVITRRRLKVRRPALPVMNRRRLEVMTRRRL